ncbi:hypothetical protein EVA_01371 [gut metagenome]|uniref:Uncharacterized protein n=1 Tax=gut metagenome TaxID=749906 RepID=J9H7W0_9ZZZZ
MESTCCSAKKGSKSRSSRVNLFNCIGCCTNCSRRRSSSIFTSSTSSSERKVAS